MISCTNDIYIIAAKKSQFVFQIFFRIYSIYYLHSDQVVVKTYFMSKIILEFLQIVNYVIIPFCYITVFFQVVGCSMQYEIC